MVWTLGATYLAWRVTFGFWKKLGKRIQHNVTCKADLEYGYDKVATRIDVMHQLIEKEQPTGLHENEASYSSKLEA